jgi:hypothetical protein
MRWARHAEGMGETRIAYEIVVGKAAGYLGADERIDPIK